MTRTEGDRIILDCRSPRDAELLAEALPPQDGSYSYA